MGDIFGGDEDDGSKDALNRQVALQEKRIADAEREQSAKDLEEDEQRKLGRRGRKSLMSKENMGSGFMRSNYS